MKSLKIPFPSFGSYLSNIYPLWSGAYFCMEEIWKPIKSFEGIYEVSNFGNVKSVSRAKKFNNAYMEVTFQTKERLLSPCVRGGYLRVRLQSSECKKMFSVHRLVAEAFIENTEGKKTINHIDANKTNNHVSNLEWNTILENVRHARNKGLFPKLVLTDTHKKALVESCSRKVVDSSTGKTYDSIKQAANTLGYKRSTLTHYLIGSRKNRTTLSYFD